MTFWKLLTSILTDNAPPVPNLQRGFEERLFDDGLTMGTLVLGRQGSGKTTALARHIVDYMKRYPDRAIFVLDWSGSISDTILKLILMEEDKVKERLLSRLVYDELGNPDWVVPLPEFHPLYGEYEAQVQRVANNLGKLSDTLITAAPYLAGISFKEVAPHVFRLLTAATNEYLESWQITEAKKLIADQTTLLQVCAVYGYKVPAAKWYMEKIYKNWSDNERDMRTYALLGMLGAIETREARARLGYYKPGWTAKEAIEKGQMILVNGARMINHKLAQHYLFTQAYSLIMAEINQRVPANPEDKPVALILDEVYSLLQIPGMAEEVGMISPIYRSRKLELYIVIQALWQLADNLQEQVWSLGNVISYGIQNFDEAYNVAQQLFPYFPQSIKREAQTENQHPLMEPDRGQYTTIANWLQRLPFRACVMRRYSSERKMEKRLLHVIKTKDIPERPLEESLEQVKVRLLKEHGVPVRDALEVINRRKLLLPTKKPVKPPVV